MSCQPSQADVALASSPRWSKASIEHILELCGLACACMSRSRQTVAQYQLEQAVSGYVRNEALEARCARATLWGAIQPPPQTHP